jgi:protein YibB
MNSNISIVTAFFDINRGSWTPDKGFPHYIQRSRAEYLRRFNILQKIKTDITIFTSPDLENDVRAMLEEREHSATIIKVDLNKRFGALREKIQQVQSTEEFKSRINPSQKSNPEYREPDYVLVTNLKAFFVAQACALKVPVNDQVAWVDFGFCRSMNDIPTSKVWNYTFNNEKLHLFNYKQPDVSRPIEDVISNNDVYILGAQAVATQDKWELFSSYMETCQQELLEKNIVDDDQGLWLMSYLKNPESFELHEIPDHQLGHYPFVHFNKFNNG